MFLQIYAIFQKWLENNETATFESIIQKLKNARLIGCLQRWLSQYRNEGRYNFVMV